MRIPSGSYQTLYRDKYKVIYQPHMEQSDWSEFTTMVQLWIQILYTPHVANRK